LTSCALRARLSEALGRLERVVAALDGGNSNAGKGFRPPLVPLKNADGGAAHDQKLAEEVPFQKHLADSLAMTHSMS
jgi:hypothetical protein